MLRLDPLKEEGNQLFQKGKFEQALEKYNAILIINENHEPALLNKALACKRLKRYEEALKTLEQLLTLNPKHAKGLYQKAWILQQQEHFEEAKSFYEQAIAIDAKSIDAKIGLFECEQQSNAKVIFAVADLKLTADNQVKILEFGNYINSDCSGYEKLTGNKILDHFKETGLPPLTLALEDDSHHIRYDFSNFNHLKCRDLKPSVLPYSSREIASHSAIYAGWAIKQLNQDVMILGDTTVDIILGHKTLTHDCFEKANLLDMRPKTFKILRNGKTSPLELAKKIKSLMPNVDRIILKSPELSEGKGVMVVHREDLDEIVSILLDPGNDDEIKHKMAFFVAKKSYDQNELEMDYTAAHIMILQNIRHSMPTYYLIEEYVQNKPVLYKNENYDPTMRVVFVLAKDKKHAPTFTPLAYYWKLPPKSMQAITHLRDKSISSYTENHAIASMPSEEDKSIVFEILNKNLPVLFSCMLKQPLIEIAKTDYEKNKYSNIWPLISSFATYHGYFDIAKHAFLKFKEITHLIGEKIAIAKYYLYLCNHDLISENYDAAIENSSICIKNFTNNIQYAEAHFIRGIANAYKYCTSEMMGEKVEKDLTLAAEMNHKYSTKTLAFFNGCQPVMEQKIKEEVDAYMSKMIQSETLNNKKSFRK